MLYDAGLCSVTYWVSRSGPVLPLDGPPETGSALMNDGKTLRSFKVLSDRPNV